LVNFPVLNICKLNWESGSGSSFSKIIIWIPVLESVAKSDPVSIRFLRTKGGTQHNKTIKDQWPEPSQGRQKGEAKERPKGTESEGPKKRES
jgi:hypothetical protein